MTGKLKIVFGALLAIILVVIWRSEGSVRHLESIVEGAELDWKPLAMPGDLTEGHAFIGEDCRACHTAVVGVERQKCVTCHVSEAALLGRQPTAFHADVGDCAGCHVEHGGDIAISRMDHGFLLKMSAFTSAHGSETTRLELEVKSLLAAFSGGKGDSRKLVCAECHGNEDVHFGYFGDECADCHGDTTWDVPDFRHPSPASTECSHCHEAPPSHYMGHFKMVSQSVARKPHSPVEACQDCHETNAWNDIAGVGFYKHH